MEKERSSRVSPTSSPITVIAEPASQSWQHPCHFVSKLNLKLRSRGIHDKNFRSSIPLTQAPTSSTTSRPAPKVSCSGSSNLAPVYPSSTALQLPAQKFRTDLIERKGVKVESF